MKYSIELQNNTRVTTAGVGIKTKMMHATGALPNFINETNFLPAQEVLN